jgi:predicted nucleic acid-binding protein
MHDEIVFLDSNLWIYLFLNSENEADKPKQSKVKQLLLDYPLVVCSAQVLNEVSNTLFRKYHLEVERIESHIESILSLVFMQTLNEAITLKALSLLKKYHFSFYDALIVAAASQTKCDGSFRLQVKNN